MARFSIGIDLGTSNCALSYVDLERRPGEPQILPVRQLFDLESVASSELLPSFLYYPVKEEEERLPKGGDFAPFDGNRLVVGGFARERSATLPGRVVHSAKSWLCHGGVDREARILPWGSEEIPDGRRLSPVEAGAYYLGLLRAVWEERFGKEAPFGKQDIVVTVPASFDEAAQRLTLETARLAGFPGNVRLLEEPQAAFYYWLNRNRQGRELVRLLPGLREREQVVLVCDIGGGTSDFSLFAVGVVEDEERIPAVRRIEVSDHLLLGGDNIDLALAHLFEGRLVSEGRRLAAGQWAYLLAQVRELKERILGGLGGGEESFSVSVPGSGSALFASTKTATMSRVELEREVLEGFFPVCGAEERPVRQESGLKEFGLPYAADPAITRHLAEFLRGRKVDAVFFTGGTLKPEPVRKRLFEVLAAWQEGERPAVLVNEEPDLAVARGAACYGEVLGKPFGRITGGYPHSVYLEIQAKGREREPRLVCILPKGFEENQTIRIDQLDLELLVGRPVRFQPYFSTFREEDLPGDVVGLDREIFRPLPPLQTGIALQEGLVRPATGRLPVFLESSLNELGLLRVTALHVDAEGREFRWELSFNLRKGEEAEEVGSEGPEVSEEELERGLGLISELYSRGKGGEGKPRRLVRDLEEIFGRKRQEWNLVLLRTLWPPMEQGMTLKSRSVDHEATWLNLAGYLLRPGYGAELDPFRIDELWRLQGLGLSFPKEARVLNQWWILWRRVAGGLDRERQERLLAPVLSQIRNKSADGAELFRFLGSLERVGTGLKEEISGRLVQMILEKRPRALGDAIWALGRVLNRVPLYAGPDSVVRRELVADAFAKLRKMNWGKGPFDALAEAFARACRMSGVRENEIGDDLRAEVLGKLEESGADERQIRVVREYVPIEAEDQANLFGEAFPAGLILF